jgi:trans-aconitate methyltransferase
MPELSPRLLQIVEALPLRPGMRMLEIGCGPGAMARELARRLPQGFVLGIDRSTKAIGQAAGAENPPNLAFRQASAQAFTLAPRRSLSTSPWRSASAPSTAAIRKRSRRASLRSGLR